MSLLTVAALVFAAATPGATDGAAPDVTTPAAMAPAPTKSADPIICERIKEVGSLLATKKICRTKSQWADERRQDRMNIERAQVQQRGMQAP